jgi:opacity protein-like surface antigen
MIAVGFALAALVAAPAARADDAVVSGTGFRATLGPATSRLVLPARTASELAAAGVPLESHGLGMELSLAWAFSPRFTLGLSVLGTNADDGDEPRSPMLVEALIEATTHLRPGERIDPFLTGGLGGAGIGFGEDPDDGQTIEAAVLSLGGGVDVRLSRHWGMSFTYRYAVLDIDRQTVTLPDAPAVPLEVSGDAEAHHLSVSCGFRL